MLIILHHYKDTEELEKTYGITTWMLKDYTVTFILKKVFFPHEREMHTEWLEQKSIKSKGMKDKLRLTNWRPFNKIIDNFKMQVTAILQKLYNFV